MTSGNSSAAGGPEIRYNPGTVILLLYLSVAFNLWMLLDATRRRAPLLWFLVLLTPIGGVVYFFSVKLRDMGVRPIPTAQGETAAAKPDLQALREAAEESPSFQNRTALGWALLEASDAEGAQAQFALALRSHPQDYEGLLGSAASAMALRDPEAAVEALSNIVERNFRYRDYQAARLLTQALLEAERNEDALELTERIAQNSRRYIHQLELARMHLRLGNKEAARLTAVGLLAEWDREPEARRDRWALVAGETRKLLEALEQSPNR